MATITNKDAWLKLFATNDVALLAAITLCKRFGPQNAELTAVQEEFIQNNLKWLYETTDDEMETLVDEHGKTMSVQEYNNEFYPAYNKAECFVRTLDHALQKSDENARMQCRVVGWDNETKDFLTKALLEYKSQIKKTIRIK